MNIGSTFNALYAPLARIADSRSSFGPDAPEAKSGLPASRAWYEFLSQG
ncbi:hypothetical protein [Arthrobacter methylotrophus]